MRDWTKFENAEFYRVMEEMSRDEAHKAAVYAMNTLLLHKGIYSPAEFETRVIEYAKKHRKSESHREASPK